MTTTGTIATTGVGLYYGKLPASVRESEDPTQMFLDNFELQDDMNEAELRKLTSWASKKTKSIWSKFMDQFVKAAKWLVSGITVGLLGCAVVLEGGALGATTPGWVITAGVVVALVGAAVAGGSILYLLGSFISWSIQRWNSQNDW